MEIFIYFGGPDEVCFYFMKYVYVAWPRVNFDFHCPFILDVEAGLVGGCIGRGTGIDRGTILW